MKTLIFSHKEMKDIKAVKQLEKLHLLIKGVSKTIKKRKKEQKGGFLSMLLGTIGANLLTNKLVGK